MNKPTIILLLILTIVSCGKKTEPLINESQFENKTFSLIFESEKDTLIVEFQDSTHQIFGNLWQGKIPWRISHYNNSNFLVLDNRAIGIKKIGEDKFQCTYIGLADNSFEMVERKPKWDKELLSGTWVDKSLFEYYSNDSIPKPPPIPLPPGFSESDFQQPPLYKISKDSIFLSNKLDKSESEIHVNNTGEFIKMNLTNYAIGYTSQENFWKIKYLSDSIMIIDKISYDLLHTKHDKDLTYVKLTKKR